MSAYVAFNTDKHETRKRAMLQLNDAVLILWSSTGEEEYRDQRLKGTHP